MVKDVKFGFGAPRILPDDQPEVTAEVHKAWCKKRVLTAMQSTELGSLGNAFGGLNADLMRHESTVPLMEKLQEIPATRAALQDFIDKELT